MPIDTSIITNGYNPAVKPVDPQELAMRKAQLAGMQQQQQIGAAQLTGANFQNQQNQAAADRAQKVRDTLAANPNADDKTLLASGMDAAQLFAYKKSMQEYQKSSVDLKASQNKLQDQEKATLGSIFGAIKAANYDPKVASSLLDMAKQQHPDYAPHIDQLTSQFGQMQPEQFKSLVDGAATASMSTKDQASAASQAQTAAAKAAQAKTAQDRLTLETPGIQSENTIKANTATGATPLTAKDKAELAIKQQQTSIERERLAQDTASVQMTPEALDNAADSYHTTGVLPNLGYGKAGAANKTAVMNRTAEKYGSFNPGSAAADFAANKGSIRQLQEQSDKIHTFEDTALANLKPFEDAAKKMIDTGNPILNKPLRYINKNLLGSENQAVFSAALNIVNNEFAKINAGSYGNAPISDSARHEMQNVLDGNATLKQALAVVNLLKTDAKNRENAFTNTITAAKKRLAAGSGGGGASSQNRPPLDSILFGK